MNEVVPPTERTCERCGRRDVWDEDVSSWSIDSEDGEKLIGDPYCSTNGTSTGTTIHSPSDAGGAPSRRLSLKLRY